MKRMCDQGATAKGEDFMILTEPPEYREDGVDPTLIRWMLSLTHTERLAVLQQSISSIYRLQDAKIRTEHSGTAEPSSSS